MSSEILDEICSDELWKSILSDVCLCAKIEPDDHGLPDCKIRVMYSILGRKGETLAEYIRWMFSINSKGFLVQIERKNTGPPRVASLLTDPLLDEFLNSYSFIEDQQIKFYCSRASGKICIVFDEMIHFLDQELKIAREKLDDKSDERHICRKLLDCDLLLRVERQPVSECNAFGIVKMK